MAVSNVEAVRRCFDAFAQHDVDALLALLDPDVEVRSLMTEAERSIYRGHQGVREWFLAVLEVFPDWHPRPAEMRELDDSVITSFRAIATGTASGVRIDQAYWQAARVRDGKLLYFGFFRTEEDALEAIGT